VDHVISVEGKVDAQSGDPKVLVDAMHEELPGETCSETDIPLEEKATPGGEIMEEPPTDDPAADISEPAVAGEKENGKETNPTTVRETFLEDPKAAMQEFAAEIKPAVEIVPPLPTRMAAATIGYLVPPAEMQTEAGTLPGSLRMVVVVLRSNGEKEREVRRMNRLLGLLRSSPGRDHFSFLIFEQGHQFLIEFPNETTGINPDLIGNLRDLAGADNVSIESIPVH